MGPEAPRRGLIFERPIIRRTTWRKQVLGAPGPIRKLPEPEADSLTRSWNEHWGSAVGAGWSMRQVEGTSRTRRHLRRDSGRGWTTLAEYREAANRLGRAVQNFGEAHPGAIVVATEWDEDAAAGWSRLAFPNASLWRRFEDEDEDIGGRLMVDELGEIEDMHAAIDLVLLDCASFVIVSPELDRALGPYDGGIDFLRSSNSR